MEQNSSLTVAYMNIQGQTGLNVSKQTQIEDFLKKNKIDILNCQEINIEEDSFKSCSFITSSYNIIQNNAINKYGTASKVKNELIVENIKTDINGRAIVFDINNLTFGNIYLHSGTDGQSRGLRENYISEIIPHLLTNRKDSGEVGGDFNCITNKQDCTKNPESKMSPSLKRLVQTFNLQDSFRHLYPSDKIFSRYYSRMGQEGATRIDRSYYWGGLTPTAAWYESVAFSDHMAHIVKFKLPNNLDRVFAPKSRPFFKTKSEVIKDEVFRQQLKESMVKWQEIKARGLHVLHWWELIVKPGIKKLAINRSKELKKQKRRVLNMLLLKQVYFTKKLQEGELNKLGMLREVQDLIMEWYEIESTKIVVQARIEDMEESEKVRIFHHEQHQRHIKKSSILKLKTEEHGIIEGHNACSLYLQNQLATLLLRPATLNVHSQQVLLQEVGKVFTDNDNALLENPPTKEEIKEVLFKSNLNAAPGTDGITSLLYHNHWDIMGESLHETTKATMSGEIPTLSQRTSLMVFGCKPKKSHSLLPSDKRRISLMNADFKILTGLQASRFRQLLTHTLSPSQFVGGDDRRIHHGINRARDCIQAVSKTKKGCALLDLDFQAAFDNTVFEWVFCVLRKKGLSENVISMIKNIYSDRITIL